MDAVVPAAGESETLVTLVLGGNEFVFKAGAGSTGGGVGLVESTAGPGSPGPPPHRHRVLHDMFPVLAGTPTLRLDDGTVELGPGGFEEAFREAAAALGDGPFDPAVPAGIVASYDIALAE